MKQTTAALLPLLALSAAFAGAGWAAESAAPSTGPDRETLYQVSLLQGLTLGDYRGIVSVGTLKGKGDTGIGTLFPRTGPRAGMCWA